MRREEKSIIIDGLAEQLKACSNFYITDISGLNALKTYNLRKGCYEKNVRLLVVKNTLLREALKQIDFTETEMLSALKGPTAIMFSEVANSPAKLIKAFRKDYKEEKPLLKAAYAQECTFIGNNSLEDLCNIKSREELIGEIIGLLQSPAKNVISALQSGGQTISGIVKTLSERPE